MKDSARYAKVVAWSEEDQHYIGYAPGLVSGGCCHGDDEKAVFAELCEIVDEDNRDWTMRTVARFPHRQQVTTSNNCGAVYCGKNP